MGKIKFTYDIYIDIICIERKKNASTRVTIAVVSYDMNAFATFHYSIQGNEWSALNSGNTLS